MKKFFVCFLVFVLLFSMTGCQALMEQSGNVANEFKDVMKNAGEALVEGAKEAAKDAVDEAVDEAKDKINDKVEAGKDKLDDAFGKDEDAKPMLPQTGPGSTAPTIHYDANGGCNAPADHTYERDTRPRLSNQLPLRPGYHFVGWSTEQNSEISVTAPGKKTHNSFSGDITFHALWEKHENPLTSTKILRYTHNYTVTKENDIAVSIRCSCGLEVTDRTISKSEFSHYYRDAFLWWLRAGKEDEYYTLYKAQDVGTIALMFNTDFYKDPDSADRVEYLFNTADELAGVVSEFNGYVADVAEWMSENDEAADVAEDFFDDVLETTDTIDNATEKVALAVSIYNLSNSVKQMTTSEDEADALIGFVDTVGFMISYTPLDFYYEPMLDVLKEGITLWKKCKDNQATFHMIMSEDVVNDTCKTLDAVFPGYAAEFLFSCKDGCRCDNGESSCPFDNGPTVNEVYLRLADRESYAQIPKQVEKELIVWYLAEKSAHDLYQIAGVTVDEYYSMVK